MTQRAATFVVGADGQHSLVMSAHRSTVSDLPHPLDSDELWHAVPTLFLDHDGVLTPIVDDPAAATLGDDVRAAVQRAADRLTVAAISGRGLDDVSAMVDLPGLACAGSHGFDMLLPAGAASARATTTSMISTPSNGRCATIWVTLRVSRSSASSMRSRCTPAEPKTTRRGAAPRRAAGVVDRTRAAVGRLDHPDQTARLLRSCVIPRRRPTDG
jgi:hypothetical protein